ncbi:HD domain-containing phosphohydrolase [Alloactinosynnema sp. L-07]|uniref:HD domain-containing phosphohydrolase n=1 Tax=Alloactinosynnema sp. L-07 TaxID=1653480 RepID=UPI001E4C3EA2|nr:HD domain-containing phosphohydrolase [Alloactinosynnema sp. L-07]
MATVPRGVGSSVMMVGAPSGMVVVAVRLVDLLAGLSRLADLGFGLRAGEAMRSCALATALARSMDLPDGEVRAALYTALLHHVGCTGYAHETASLFGDELAVNVAAGRGDDADPRDVFTTFLPMLTHGKPVLERARLVLTTLAKGSRFGVDFTTAACEVGRAAARRLGLPDEVQGGVYHVYEMWAGSGFPSGLRGDEIPVASRIARLTGVAVLFDTVGGVDLAVAAVAKRGGGMLDPGMVAHFTDRAAAMLGDVNRTDPRSVALAAEPRPVVSVADERLAEVAEVFADLADLKTPYLHGHSTGVAALAGRAGERLGLTADLRVAGLLHDVGRVAVSTSVWEKPGRLTGDDGEQVRLHAYHSERILAGSDRLAPLAPIVGRHHERLDGSGYHRGCTGADLAMPARVLAAADAYQAMTERRPHRPALPPERARVELIADARAGLLDAEAVRAVLAVAGDDPGRVRRALPAGLSDRELEVLRLVAEGCGNARIAERLVISRRTAEHHVQHIYTKIGVSSRAAAALFAMEHDLLADKDG